MPFKIIGLTGGIGMGKSTTAAILAKLGLPVHHPDAAVHALLGKNGKAVKQVAKSFPSAVKAGAIDRKILGGIVFQQPELLPALENILHPLVRRAEKVAIAAARRAKAPAIVLDIPLLFETGGEARCDFTICVTATAALQKARVMRRPGMTPAKFKTILKRQLPDAARKRRADYVVTTTVSRADTRKQLEIILREHNIIT